MVVGTEMSVDVPAALLSLQGVSVEADGLPILDEVDLSIMPAETLVIFGESGAGKSTLINVIADCVPFSGSVLRSDDLDSRSIGISYDSFAAFAELRTCDVVEMYSRLRHAEPNHVMAEQLRLHEVEERRFRALSAGERKRLALYAALFFDPLLAVLDEPTDGLDPMQRRAFWQLVEKRRSATVVVTHLWEEALRSHDRICLLAAGRVIGEPRSLGEWMATIPHRGRFSWAQTAAVDAGGIERFASVEAHGYMYLYYDDDRGRDAVLEVVKRNAAAYSESLVTLEDVYLLLKAKLDQKS